ncbi:MAG: DUF971 domain-containing protein [Phycisphaerales bacterium]|nr:DUF971 domain-containing protein [Planctomycetota bacterium]MBL6997574.1 DUF971 domain-containing protein [Phycisphaerales bacterium]
MTLAPKHLDIRKSEGLHVEWSDGTTSFYPCDLLRRMSPSADSKAIREDLEQNPLAILPSSSNSKVVINDGELVGNYAIRFNFSDGHSAGIYTWEYLRSLK